MFAVQQVVAQRVTPFSQRLVARLAEVDFSTYQKEYFEGGGLPYYDVVSLPIIFRDRESITPGYALSDLQELLDHEMIYNHVLGEVVPDAKEGHHFGISRAILVEQPVGTSWDHVIDQEWDRYHGVLNLSNQTPRVWAGYEKQLPDRLLREEYDLSQGEMFFTNSRQPIGTLARYKLNGVEPEIGKLLYLRFKPLDSWF